MLNLMGGIKDQRVHPIFTGIDDDDLSSGDSLAELAKRNRSQKMLEPWELSDHFHQSFPLPHQTTAFLANILCVYSDTPLCNMYWPREAICIQYPTNPLKLVGQF